MGSIVDIYSGDLLTIWKDEEWVYFSMPWVTINIPEDDFAEFFNDLNAFVHEQLENNDCKNVDDTFRQPNGHNPENPL